MHTYELGILNPRQKYYHGIWAQLGTIEIHRKMLTTLKYNSKIDLISHYRESIAL